MSECHIKMDCSDVDFEDEVYMALAGHGDGFHISHVENFRFFLQNASLVGCILRIICTTCCSMSRWGRDFSSVQTGPGAHLASCTMGTGSFPEVGAAVAWG